MTPGTPSHSAIFFFPFFLICLGIVVITTNIIDFVAYKFYCTFFLHPALQPR